MTSYLKATTQTKISQQTASQIKIHRNDQGKQTVSTRELYESGRILLSILLLIIPGLIALAFAATFIYLIIENQGNPDYVLPKELGSAMTTIIGYYFGMGASSALNKTKTYSPEEFMALLHEGQDITKKKGKS